MATTSLSTAEADLWQSVGVEPTSQTLSLATLDCDIRVQIVGDGPPVVFVHGGMTGGASWAPLVGLLTDFQCIVIDRPGCGLSEPVPGNSRSLADAKRVGDALVADVLDALDLPKAHVIGTSLGGWATQRGAAAHPDRYDRMVLMTYCVGMRPTGVPISMRMPSPPFLMKHMSRFVTPAVMRAMLKPAGMRRAIEEGAFSNVMINWMVALFRETDTAYNEMQAGPIPMTLRGAAEEVIFTADVIERITAPTVVLWGEDDPMATFDIGREYVEQLPDATIQLIPNAGHAPWVDEPQIVANAVRAHFNV